MFIFFSCNTLTANLNTSENFMSLWLACIIGLHVSSDVGGGVVAVSAFLHHIKLIPPVCQPREPVWPSGEALSW